MTSRFQKIRDYLQANPGPRTAAEIAEGIGHEGPRINVSFAIGTMVTDGWLRNTTPHNKPARFELLRTEKVIRPKLDPETAKANKQAREREREQAKRRMTPEDYKVWIKECKKRTAEQKAEAQADALRLQRLSQEAKQASSARFMKQAKTEYAAKDRYEASRQVVAMRLDSIATSPASQPEERPDTEAFIAKHRNDPAKYQVLRPGEGSAWRPMFEY